MRRIKAAEGILLSERTGELEAPQKENESDTNKSRETRNQPVDLLEQMFPDSAATHSKCSDKALQGFDGQLGPSYGTQMNEPAHPRQSDPNLQLTPMIAIPSSPNSETKLPLILETTSFGIKPLKITEPEAAKLLAWYQNHTSSKILQSYCPLSELITKAESGYEPYWLCYANDTYPLEGASNLLRDSSFDLLRGLAVFHIDPASQQKPRVTILHASTLEETKVPDLVRKLVEYIWKNVNCEEIRVELTHFMQEGRLAPCDVLKASFQGMKFRWKTLINDQQGKRVVVLGLARGAGDVFVNPR